MLRRGKFALCHNHFRHKPNPLAITRKAKGLTLPTFLSLNDCRPELRKKRRFAIRAILQSSESKPWGCYRNDGSRPAGGGNDPVHPEVFDNLSIVVTSMHQCLHYQG